MVEHGVRLSRDQVNALNGAEQLEYYTFYCNDILCRNENSKTGKKCWNLSLPVETSCRCNAPCKKGCYACKGRQILPNVLGGYYRNWRLWDNDPRNYEEQICAKLAKTPLPFFRYSDAGDIPSMEYFAMMVRIALRFPDIRFLVYTKQYEIVNKWLDQNEKLPDNLTVRFSYWDKSWEVPNPHNLPRAWVSFKKLDKNPDYPAKAFTCHCNPGTTCSTCGVCFNKKVNDVIFHEH